MPGNFFKWIRLKKLKNYLLALGTLLINLIFFPRYWIFLIISDFLQGILVFLPDLSYYSCHEIPIKILARSSRRYSSKSQLKITVEIHFVFFSGYRWFQVRFERHIFLMFLILEETIVSGTAFY